ncbi:hypothetical protein ACNHKD_12600 [Methylocystis sp. JAN1]|uniref:hypothetical protein n=1 Tax=Methylocystis sp. JAN1 TaxID=3397211 RepID=UPI003FA25E0B
MRTILTAALLLASVATSNAEQAGQATAPKTTTAGDTQEFFDARGHLLGSVTKIGGVTYFNGPDGNLVGTAETVEGRRIYKSY